MSKQYYLILLLVFSFSLGFSQKRETLEQKVTRLEKRIDSLQRSMKLHTMFYNHSNIEIARINALLALRLNRNFTYSAYFYEGEPDYKDGNGYQSVCYFVGYRLAEDTRQQLASNRSSFLESVRGNLKNIRSIVVGDDTTMPKDTDEYKVYPTRLIIKYYDNAGSSDELIVADTFLNSLKVRIDGVLQEIGWE